MARVDRSAALPTTRWLPHADNDPTNKTDPTGMRVQDCGLSEPGCVFPDDFIGAVERTVLDEVNVIGVCGGASVHFGFVSVTADGCIADDFNRLGVVESAGIGVGFLLDVGVHANGMVSNAEDVWGLSGTSVCFGLGVPLSLTPLKAGPFIKAGLCLSLKPEISLSVGALFETSPRECNRVGNRPRQNGILEDGTDCRDFFEKVFDANNYSGIYTAYLGVGLGIGIGSADLAVVTNTWVQSPGLLDYPNGLAPLLTQPVL